MTDLRDDGFLNGRLRILQPVRGYRAGADAVMLAAACPARAGQTVLELGCGAGVASLCLGWRVPGLRLSGVEQQPRYAALARENATRNAIGFQVLTGDLAAMPDPLRQISFDHVIANPPYFLGGTPASDDGRARSRQEQTALALWIRAGLRRLRPDGLLTMIQRVDRLDEVICALQGRAGAITVLPVAARSGREAGRIILSARKGARSPLRLLPPLIMHGGAHHCRDGEDLSPQAAAILRDGAAITNLFPSHSS